MSNVYSQNYTLVINTNSQAPTSRRLQGAPANSAYSLTIDFVGEMGFANAANSYTYTCYTFDADKDLVRSNNSVSVTYSNAQSSSYGDETNSVLFYISDENVAQIQGERKGYQEVWLRDEPDKNAVVAKYDVIYKDSVTIT